MKKIKFLLLSLIVLLVSTASFGEVFVNAKESNDEKSLLEQQKENLKNEEIKVEVLSDKDLKKIDEVKNEMKLILDYENKIAEDGFEKVEIDRENTKIKYSAFTEVGRVYTYVSSDVYKNEKTKEIIVSEIIYDTYSEEIKQFLVEKRSMVDPEDEEILVNYISDDYLNENVDKKDNIISMFKSFKWNGKSFACSMGGLALCGHHCGLWALFNPVAGGGCAVVCGTLFAAACAFE